VVAFKSSSNLASAYGLAVTTTMVITTVLFYVVAREKWQWSRLAAGSLCALFLVIDLGFWGANLLKIFDGGWFPVLVGISGFTIMTTWKAGRKFVAMQLREKTIPIEQFLADIERANLPRVEGTAVYLNRSLKRAPYALIHTFEHFKTVHRNLVFLAVEFSYLPKVSAAKRLEIKQLSPNSHQIILHYGYLEQPNVPRDIQGLDLDGLRLDVDQVSFMIEKQSLYATEFPGMALWREKIFTLISRNEISATDYFQLPKERVLEIGMQIAI